MGINLGLCGAVATIVVQLTVGGAMALDRVKVGIINTIGDINVFIADEKGYFAKENISAEILSFDASARMMAPLGSGEIDIGGGSTSVGLFNAIDRGIGLRVVADKGRTAEGYVYQSLMIRKNLVESGKFRSLSDLKGLRIAVGAPGVGPLSILNEAAIRGGISYSDIDKVYLAFAQQIAGMKNGAVDGAIVNFRVVDAIEPDIGTDVVQGTVAPEAIDPLEGFRLLRREGVRPIAAHRIGRVERHVQRAFCRRVAHGHPGVTSDPVGEIGPRKAGARP